MRVPVRNHYCRVTVIIICATPLLWLLKPRQRKSEQEREFSCFPFSSPLPAGYSSCFIILLSEYLWRILKVIYTKQTYSSVLPMHWSLSSNIKYIKCCNLCVSLTSEAVGHVGLEDDLAEDGGQRQRLVAFVSQRDVAVASLQAIKRQDALPNQLIVVVVDCDAQHGQVW